MILSVLLIARIASQRLRLRRRCAQAAVSAALQKLRRPLALQTNDCNLAPALAPALSVNLDGPVCARSTHLAV
jgi:hypothetical protein